MLELINKVKKNKKKKTVAQWLASLVTNVRDSGSNPGVRSPIFLPRHLNEKKAAVVHQRHLHQHQHYFRLLSHLKCFSYNIINHSLDREASTN